MQQPTLDRQPGSSPEIRVSKDAMTFIMIPPRIGERQQLVIRCDACGDIWIAIRPREIE